MEIRVESPDLAKLQGLVRKFPDVLADELRSAMQEAVLVAEAEIVQRTPVDTGRARNSIASAVDEQNGEFTGRIFVQNVPYMVPLEEGTRPHDIYPRTKKALRFTVGGRVIIRRKIHHPGTQGAHMFAEGAAAAEPRVRRIFEVRLARALNRVANGR